MSLLLDILDNSPEDAAILRRWESDSPSHSINISFHRQRLHGYLLVAPLRAAAFLKIESLSNEIDR
jgi:hypothetical protein